MARKKYVLSFEIDSRAAEAAARRVADGMARLDKAAKQAGASLDKVLANLASQGQAAANAATSAANKGAAAHQAAADRAAKAAQAAVDKQIRDQARAAAAAQKAADKMARDAQRAADKQAKEAARAAAAQAKAWQDQQNAAAKAHTQAAAAAAKQSKAAEAARAKEMVGLDQLRMSGLKMIDEQRRARERADAARVKSLTQEQVIAKARDKIIRESNRQRINEAAGLKDHYGSFTEMALGSNKKIAASVVLGTAALQGMVSMIHAAGRAFTEAGEKSREMTKNFNTQRDDLTELANVMDKPLTNQFTLDFAKYNAKTGFKPSEGKSFLTEMYNSGAQYVGTGKGKHMEEGQFEKFKVMAGQFAVLSGIEPQVMGDLAGNLLGSTDYNKYGDRAALMAMADLNTTYQVGKRGRGGNATNLTQMIKAASMSVKENREEGILKSMPEVMAHISVQGERSPEEAFTMFKRGSQGVRKIDDEKAGPLLEKAGISKGGKLVIGDLNQAIAALAPVIRAEAKARGGETKTIDILNEAFDEREAAGIGAMIEGHEKGIMADRLNVIEQNKNPEVAIKMLQGMTGSEAWMSRQADAEGQLVEMEHGAEFSKLDVIRRLVAADMLRKGTAGKNASELKNMMVDNTSFGMLGPASKLAVDEQVQRHFKSIAPPGTKPGSWMANFNFSPTAREQDLNEQLFRIEEAGGHPLEDTARKLGSTEETNKLLNEQNGLLKQLVAQGAQAKAPAPAPNAQKGPPSTLGSAAQQMGW